MLPRRSRRLGGDVRAATCLAGLLPLCFQLLLRELQLLPSRRQLLPR